MKVKLIALFLMLGSIVYSQDFNDLVFLNNGDTIKCRIISVNEINIMVDVQLRKNKVKTGIIPINEVKDYFVSSGVNPVNIIDNDKIKKTEITISDPEIINKNKELIDQKEIKKENDRELVKEKTLHEDKNKEIVYSKEEQPILSVNTEGLYMAGFELKEFYKVYYSGLGVICTGSLVSIIGGVIISPGILIIGGITTIVGYVVTVASHMKIGKAGDLIMNYSDELSKKRSIVKDNQQTDIIHDIIYKKDGTEIKVKVIEITEETIKYKNYNQPDGPQRNIVKKDIFMIIYKDGSRETF